MTKKNHYEEDPDFLDFMKGVEDAGRTLFGERESPFESMFGRTTPPSKENSQVKGLKSFARGDYGEAVAEFKNSPRLSAHCRVAYSISLSRWGEDRPQEHLPILTPLLESSSLANTLLGTFYYNKKMYSTAEVYFAQAVQLAPESETTHLNLMRAQFAGKNLEAVQDRMNLFYSQLSPEERAQKLETKIKTKKIPVPSLEIQNLDAIVSSLQ